MAEFNHSALEKEAKEKWGQTQAYKEYEEKQSLGQTQDAGRGMDQIMAEFALCMKKGETPDSTPVQDLVKKLQDYMSGFENVYDNKYITYLGRNKRLILAFNRCKLYFLTALCMKLKSKMG